MNEELNRTEDTNLEAGFDDIFAEEDSVQDTTAPEPEPAKEEAQPDTPEEELKYKVNFLGEEKELPVSELVTLSQKGMNYDHVKSELETLREKAGQSEKLLGTAKQLAASSGTSVEDYLAMIAKTAADNQLRSQIDSGVPEHIARRLMELEQHENLRTAEDEKRRAEQERQAKYDELIKEYPGVHTLPDEVATAVANGARPLEAYRAYELEKLKTELATLKKAEENKQKSTGSLQSESPATPDDFLTGFNSI